MRALVRANICEGQLLELWVILTRKHFHRRQGPDRLPHGISLPILQRMWRPGSSYSCINPGTQMMEWHEACTLSIYVRHLCLSPSRPARSRAASIVGGHRRLKSARGRAHRIPSRIRHGLYLSISSTVNSCRDDANLLMTGRKYCYSLHVPVALQRSAAAAAAHSGKSSPALPSPHNPFSRVGMCRYRSDSA